jgi:hypothetical protein
MSKSTKKINNCDGDIYVIISASAVIYGEYGNSTRICKEDFRYNGVHIIRKDSTMNSLLEVLKIAIQDRAYKELKPKCCFHYYDRFIASDICITGINEISHELYLRLFYSE